MLPASMPAIEPPTIIAFFIVSLSRERSCVGTFAFFNLDDDASSRLSWEHECQFSPRAGQTPDQPRGEGLLPVVTPQISVELKLAGLASAARTTLIRQPMAANHSGKVLDTQIAS
jgi:hypothetical protein